MSDNIDNYVVEIMGLEADGHGRSCRKHKICGMQVRVGHVLKIHRISIVNVNNKNKKVLGVFAFDRGMEGCLVGFVRLSINVPLKLYNRKIIKVLEMLKYSSIPKENACSDIFHGCALAKVTGKLL